MKGRGAKASSKPLASGSKVRSPFIVFSSLKLYILILVGCTGSEEEQPRSKQMN